MCGGGGRGGQGEGDIHILAILVAGEDADIFIYTVLRHTQCSQSPLYKIVVEVPNVSFLINISYSLPVKTARQTP